MQLQFACKKINEQFYYLDIIKAIIWEPLTMCGKFQNLMMNKMKL